MPLIEIVKRLEDQSVLKGTNVVLEIETNEKPKTVKWYKNGTEITLGASKVVIKQITDNKYQLEIPDTIEDDSANFKVFL